ncbi:hypothetical protein ACR79T_10255 [Sphingobacterium spiritivorum]|uniref:Uncharacterized protein n=1 Tax=Sphingobacterium spiritivorum TaxID=258 RepID=A0A380CS88_SPHSI|nr:hypothetical protein [Sphingobacterium spiritivorum]SUJ26580.1 Uncharacterised protein [Sphingobacterium spiritivorum]
MSKKTKVLNLKEVYYTDLNETRVALNFINSDFANSLFANANSIEMDDFARKLHKEGIAELNDQVESELLQILPQLYKHRVVEAIKESINK